MAISDLQQSAQLVDLYASLTQNMSVLLNQTNLIATLTTAIQNHPLYQANASAEESQFITSLSVANDTFTKAIPIAPASIPININPEPAPHPLTEQVI